MGADFGFHNYSLSLCYPLNQMLQPLYFYQRSNYPLQYKCHVSCLQHFVSRELGEGMDFDVYNQVISKVLTNSKYSDIFFHTFN